MPRDSIKKDYKFLLIPKLQDGISRRTKHDLPGKAAEYPGSCKGAKPEIIAFRDHDDHDDVDERSKLSTASR